MSIYLSTIVSIYLSAIAPGRKYALCLQKGARQPRQPLGRLDGFRRSSGNSDGQQQSGEASARPGSGPQKLLWFRFRVERPIGRRLVQRFSDAGPFQFESQAVARNVSASLRGKRGQASPGHSGFFALEYDKAKAGRIILRTGSSGFLLIKWAFIDIAEEISASRK